MKYRIKQVKRYGLDCYYPQYKKFLFWKKLVCWYGGENGNVPMTCFYRNKEHALERIKEHQKLKALDKPKKPIYHYID